MAFKTSARQGRLALLWGTVNVGLDSLSFLSSLPKAQDARWLRVRDGLCPPDLYHLLSVSD